MVEGEERFSALTRFKNQQWNHGRKADLRLCGIYPYHSKSVKTTCDWCNTTIYYVNDNPDLIKKNHKKICPLCMYKENSKELNEEQYKIISTMAFEQLLEEH